MKRRPTIYDLATQAQVSVSTVNRIVNGRSKVKQSTVEHVLTVADEIGFKNIASIRSRLQNNAPERTFGFLINSKKRELYNEMAKVLVSRTINAQGISGKAIIRHIEDVDSENISRELLDLGEQCDVIGCICPDHPCINYAISVLANKNVPVVAMVSNVSSPLCKGHVGSNDWQLGRSAGWFMHKLSKPEGKIGVLIGSDRYLCQQVIETSFRSYIKSHSGLELLGTKMTGESDEKAYELVDQLLKKHPDITGILVAGGGLEGAAKAANIKSHKRPTIVGMELTELTRQYLTMGKIDVLLPHPVLEIAESTVRFMIALSATTNTTNSLQKIIPFHILIGENC